MLKIKSFDKCIFELGKLPGVGRKTALRLAMHIMKMNERDVKELADSIVDLKQNIKFCKECGGLSDGELCSICADSYRDKRVVCVVEEPKDIFVIEASGRYKGVYHVLGGKIAPLDGIGPDELNLQRLIDLASENKVDEVIIATNPDIEGETTATYVHKLLKDFDVKMTRIASGVPTGGLLEFSDDITILKAIENRREMY
ncbi:MAG: recombination protein RecR [Flexistipes sinusarabici]|uniref:Recombination protein RecR n=1 Tax=Flexistipes sinusarabici TaxID=2352 RepID=A0A5D0MIN9_FLESI|nr:recombination mediator RecR [Flexistipes sinusarabici]TYB33594.1 MAG: recombination protein RecR [Flexistipes sinusarabici]